MDKELLELLRGMLKEELQPIIVKITIVENTNKRMMNMLKDIAKGYYLNGYNCSEAMLYSGNEYYKLGLDKNTFKVMAGFGGGVNTENLCGVISGGVAVLGILFVKENAHESDYIGRLTREFVEEFKQRTGSINCKELKEKYRNEKERCSYIVDIGAEILEEIIVKQSKPH